jgi:DNA-binding PadR family transcriptional regulator
VEEIALGTVLRKLNEMPGIAKLDLDLGKGGEGAGKEKLVEGAAQFRGENAEQTVLKLLMEKGPMNTREIKAALRWNGTRAYGALHALKKKGLIETDANKTHSVSRKVMQLNGASTPALPAPAKVKHGPAGRAIPGSGNIILRNILGEGAKTPTEVRALAAAQGMSPKSISGVLDRAKKGGIIKKNGAGYELTAKGLKIETGASAHG